MEQTKHTPVPWRLGKYTGSASFDEAGEFAGKFDICVDTDHGVYILASTNANFPSEAEANARRIVAAVNATAHISIERLETGEMLHMVKALRDAEQQRDQMLATMKRAAHLLAELPEQPPQLLALRSQIVEHIKAMDPAYYGLSADGVPQDDAKHLAMRLATPSLAEQAERQLRAAVETILASNNITSGQWHLSGILDERTGLIQNMWLELGARPTPFVHAGDELQRCQRYFEQPGWQPIAPGNLPAIGEHVLIGWDSAPWANGKSSVMNELVSRQVVDDHWLWADAHGEIKDWSNPPPTHWLRIVPLEGGAQ